MFDRIDLRNAMIFVALEVVILCTIGAALLEPHIPTINLEVEPVPLNSPTLEIPKTDPPKPKRRSPRRINVSRTMIAALIQKESGGNDGAEGDIRNGVYMALGCLQIWECIIIDVNTFYKTIYSHDDMFDRQKSIEVCKLYLNWYGRHYENTTNKKANMEVLARIWNGGPYGWKKESTIGYWKDIQNFL